MAVFPPSRTVGPRSRTLSRPNATRVVLTALVRGDSALHNDRAPFNPSSTAMAVDGWIVAERDAQAFDSLMVASQRKGGAERSLVALGASDAAFAWSELPPGRASSTWAAARVISWQTYSRTTRTSSARAWTGPTSRRGRPAASRVAGAEAVAGSFFDRLPAGDIYATRILHDWDDNDALRIFRAVRKAMTA